MTSGTGYLDTSNKKKTLCRNVRNGLPCDEKRNMETQCCRNLNNQTGVYQLQCLTCHKIYTGQASRPFHIRFREHYNGFTYANNRSTFAQHIINEGHTFGPMNNTINMFILIINQLDAQNLFYNKFISCLYMFRAPCAHREEGKIVLYSLWYHHIYRWPSGARDVMCDDTRGCIMQF